MIILSYIITIVLYCIVLYFIKRDWPPCKVVFRVGNQNTKCDKQRQSNALVCCYIEYRYVPSIISSTDSIYGRVACSAVCTYIFVRVVTAVILAVYVPSIISSVVL